MRTHKTTVILDEQEVDVEFTISRYYPEVRHGDTPQPAEGGNIEIVSARINGVDVTPAEEEEILELLKEKDLDIPGNAVDPDDWRDRLIDDKLTRDDPND